MTNARVAEQLRDHAQTLSEHGCNLYRVRAFRQAALTVMGLDRDVQALGIEGLREQPGIGKHLAGIILSLAETGTLPHL